MKTVEISQPFTNLPFEIPNGSAKTQDSKNADLSLQTSIRTSVCDEEAPSARGLMSIFCKFRCIFVCYKFSVKMLGVHGNKYY